MSPSIPSPATSRPSTATAAPVKPAHLWGENDPVEGLGLAGAPSRRKSPVRVDEQVAFVGGEGVHPGRERHLSQVVEPGLGAGRAQQREMAHPAPHIPVGPAVDIVCPPCVADGKHTQL